MPGRQLAGARLLNSEYLRMLGWCVLFSSGFKRALFVLVAVAVLCLGVAHYVPNFADSLVAGEVQEALAPVQKQVMLAWSSRVTLLNYIAGMRRLQAEKSQLEQQISNLTLENNHLQEYVGENQQLEKLLNFKQRNAQRFTLLGAMVISRSPDNWYSTLVVDRGSQDGVKKDMAVVSDAGLVGRVDAVWPHTADVILILDPGVAAGAMVGESSTQGVIEGSKEEPGLLRMIDLPYDAKLEPGQTVMTSGLGGIFPGDVSIGKVLQFNNGGSDLNTYALVQPDVDFNRLEDVFIITQARSAPEPVISPSPVNSQPSATPAQSSPVQPPATPVKSSPVQPPVTPAQPVTTTQPSVTPAQPVTTTQPSVTPAQPVTTTQPSVTPAQPPAAQTQPNAAPAQLPAAQTQP